ncbi:hypothetical protein NDU88_002148 [Pleurodeles waltl]|uniref:Uncharacterized protein n=1 Tax=Pleurodeles waltl TaxID=8319 RepID=A0AAV7UZ03_PLEWA|nr:hypothetical protein NDU88_002148 [Pleurodeles waltl]
MRDQGAFPLDPVVWDPKGAIFCPSLSSVSGQTQALWNGLLKTVSTGDPFTDAELEEPRYGKEQGQKKVQEKEA